MCEGVVRNCINELSEIKNKYPELIDYINDCENNGVKPDKICDWTKSKIEALKLIGENAELQEIYNELVDQINNPEMIIGIIKSYTSAVNIAEEHPELGISKKTLRTSIGNITNILYVLQNQLIQIKS